MSSAQRCRILFLSTVLAAGCQTIKARNYEKRPGKKVTLTMVYLFWGATEKNATIPCEHGVERISEGASFWGGLVSVLTLGLVVVGESEVRCAAA